jgi:hypothetical protein
MYVWQHGFHIRIHVLNHICWERHLCPTLPSILFIYLFIYLFFHLYEINSPIVIFISMKNHQTFTISRQVIICFTTWELITFHSTIFWRSEQTSRSPGLSGRFLRFITMVPENRLPSSDIYSHNSQFFEKEKPINHLGKPVVLWLYFGKIPKTGGSFILKYNKIHQLFNKNKKPGQHWYTCHT